MIGMLTLAAIALCATAAMTALLYLLLNALLNRL
jgi:hypothetical protein